MHHPIPLITFENIQFYSCDVTSCHVTLYVMHAPVSISLPVLVFPYLTYL